jgi:hypothetical protein
MSKKVSLIVAVGVGIILVAGIVFALFKSNGSVLGKANSDFVHYTGVLIGSHVATTTAGVLFNSSTGSMSATTSYIAKIGGNVENAVFTLKALNVSSTFSAVSVALQGSNDDFCDTKATSTVDARCSGDCVLTGDINWFDAGNNLKNTAQNKTLASSTNYVYWSGMNAGDGSQIVLTDLNYECLKLNVSASSTNLYAEVRTK